VQGTQPQPFVQWNGPLVAPQGECRTEAAIFRDLADRLGLPPVFPADADVLALLHDGALAEHGLSMDTLRKADRGVVVLPPMEPGGFLDRTTDDGTLDGSPEMLAPARARAEAAFAHLIAAPPEQLRLITRRTSRTINTALHNVERLKQGSGADNPLYIAPDDARRLAIADGARVRITNAYGSIEAPAKVDATLRPGVVAMTHGWGNAQTSGQPVAQRHPGVNVNALAPTGPGTFDPVSTMSQLTGIPVDVAPIG